MKADGNKYIYLITPFAMLESYSVVRALHDTSHEFKFWERGWTVNFLEFVLFMATGYLLVGLVHLTRSKYKITASNPKRLLQQMTTQLGIFILAGSVLVGVLGPALMELFYEEVTTFDLLLIYIISMSYSTMYWMTITGIAFFNSSVQTKLKVEQMALERKESELKYLKSQIQPHTFFNVMNNIYFLMDEDVTKAKATLSTFSDMLSYQLYDCDAELVELVNEIEYISNYIEIERIRREQVKIRFDVDISSTPTRLLPPFLLLPFVENTFKHLGTKNWVSLSVKTSKNQFQFIAENAVDIINGNECTQGIGLNNVRKRLDLLFPEKHILKITKSDESYKVVLELMYDEN